MRTDLRNSRNALNKITDCFESNSLTDQLAVANLIDTIPFERDAEQVALTNDKVFRQILFF